MTASVLQFVCPLLTDSESGRWLVTCLHDQAVEGIRGIEFIVDLDANTLQLMGQVQELVTLPTLRPGRPTAITLRRPDGSVWDLETPPVRSAVSW